jgi:uncharacterized protein YlxP (DUF503 family)
VTVGTLQLQLHIPGCRSLKEKRGVIRPLISRIRKDFNVSVAEVDKQDLHQSTSLAVSVVGTDGAFVNSVLSNVVKRVERERDCYLQDYSIELL